MREMLLAVIWWLAYPPVVCGDKGCATCMFWNAFSRPVAEEFCVGASNGLYGLAGCDIAAPAELVTVDVILQGSSASALEVLGVGRLVAVDGFLGA